MNNSLDDAKNRNEENLDNDEASDEDGALQDSSNFATPPLTPTSSVTERSPEIDTFQKELSSAYAIISRALRTLEKSEQTSTAGESNKNEDLMCNEIAPVNKNLNQSNTISDDTTSKTDEDEVSANIDEMLAIIENAVTVVPHEDETSIGNCTEKTDSVKGRNVCLDNVSCNSMEDVINNREETELINVEHLFQNLSETTPVNKSSNQYDTPFRDPKLRSSDVQNEFSCTINKMFDTIQNALAIAYEVNEKSDADCAGETAGVENTSKTSGNVGHNETIKTDPSERIHEAGVVSLSQHEMLEIDITLVDSIRIADILQDITAADDEIKEMIGAMLDTQETILQLSSSLELVLTGLDGSSSSAQVGNENPIVEEELKQWHDNIEGRELMDVVNTFNEAIKKDISLWGVFRRTIQSYKQYVTQHAADDDSSYSAYNAGESIKFKLQELRTQMNQARTCRNLKDEYLIQLRQKVRTFLCKTRVQIDRTNSPSRKSPERKRFCK